MKRLITLLAVALTGFSLLVAEEPARTPSTVPAQTPPQAPEKPISQDTYEPTKAGDQFIRFALGVSAPLFNITPSGIETDTNLFMGGAGSIWYAQYIAPRVVLGGELNFCFNNTLGQNLLFYLPVTFKATYVFIFDRFQVPLSVGAGFAFQSYNGLNYFGPILKPEAGVFYQYSPEWSFGATANWNIIPQWYKDSSGNRTGNILDTFVGVRYHF